MITFSVGNNITSKNLWEVKPFEREFAQNDNQHLSEKLKTITR
jgi:hypothetical protein